MQPYEVDLTVTLDVSFETITANSQHEANEIGYAELCKQLENGPSDLPNITGDIVGMSYPNPNDAHTPKPNPLVNASTLAEVLAPMGEFETGYATDFADDKPLSVAMSDLFKADVLGPLDCLVIADGAGIHLLPQHPGIDGDEQISLTPFQSTAPVEDNLPVLTKEQVLKLASKIELSTIVRWMLSLEFALIGDSGDSGDGVGNELARIGFRRVV